MAKENLTNTEETGGIDSVIGMVDGFIKNPKSVTPESLEMLKEDLVDLKGFLEPEDEDMEDMEEKPKGKPGGILITIGNMRRKK